jgi:hypothetical protein
MLKFHETLEACALTDLGFQATHSHTITEGVEGQMSRFDLTELLHQMNEGQTVAAILLYTTGRS